MKQLKLLGFLFFLISNAWGQSDVVPMDKGLPGSVVATCFDSLGNLHVVTGHMFSDTIQVFKWDSASRKWSIFAEKEKLFLESGMNKVTAHFLYGNLYISGISDKNYRSAIWKIRDTSWTKIATVSHNQFNLQWESITSIKKGNKIYYGANSDTFAGIVKPGVIEFNGISFKNFKIVNQISLYQSFAVLRDTLYYAKGNYINRMNDSSFTTFHNVGSEINGLTAHQGSLVYSSNGIKELRNGKIVNSITTQLIRPIPKSVGKRLFICPQNYYGRQGLYTLSSSFVLSNNLFNQYYDTTDMKITNYANRVYISSKVGLKLNAYDFNNIAELNLDSLKAYPFDTICVRIYRDKNKNGVFDGNDVSTAGYVVDMNSNNGYYTNATEYYEIYALDNENTRLEFRTDFNSDSCYKAAFSGGVSTRTYKSPLTRDTILLPIWRTNSINKGYNLNAYASYNARLNASNDLSYNVNNRDCDYQSQTVELEVTLDSSTTYLNASIPYKSKTGNVLVFDMDVNTYQSAYLTININYSSTKYALNQIVSHGAKMKVFNGVDTIVLIDTIRQRMVYSHDPNAKHSYPEGKINYGLKKIRYFIEFQNEGNDDAWRVTVVDTLNLKMPLVYFQMVGSSHPYTVSHVNNVVTWVFNNIYLKPKSTDEEGSKGFLVFDAYINSELRVGDSIMNKASIYFDYNDPIHTNFAIVKREDNQDALENRYLTEGYSLYPNPVEDNLHIKNTSNQKHTYYIYSTIGQLIETIELDFDSEYILNVSNLETGVFILVREDGKSQHFVKI